MKKGKNFITETNQNLVDLTYVNVILLRMKETPFPVTPRELLNWQCLDFENIDEALFILLYMEEREYLKNIGTIKKPVFEITSLGEIAAETIQNSPVYKNVEVK